MTKAEIIRQALSSWPDKKPSEISELLNSKHPTLNFRPNEISTHKSAIKRKEGQKEHAGKMGMGEVDENQPSQPDSSTASTEGAAMVAVVAGATGDVATNLRKLKEAAEALGGTEEAKRILDMLK